MLYEIDKDNYILCYKVVTNNFKGCQFHDSRYKFNKIGEELTTLCNYNEEDFYGNGFTCETYDNAIHHLKMCNINRNKKFILLKLKVHIDTMCMLKSGDIRAEKIIIDSFL